jgi:cbb3-type cytochrome oxidase maturation protein
MSSLFVLIPLSLVLLGFAVWGLLWAIERRQFEDLDTPPWRVVLDDDKAPPADAAPGAAAPPPPTPDARSDARSDAPR